MANTTEDKLAYLSGTKDALKTNLISKGMDVTSETPFRRMAEMVGEIQGTPPETVLFEGTLLTKLIFAGADEKNNIIVQNIDLNYGSQVPSFKILKGSIMLAASTIGINPDYSNTEVLYFGKSSAYGAYVIYIPKNDFFVSGW